MTVRDASPLPPTHNAVSFPPSMAKPGFKLHGGISTPGAVHVHPWHIVTDHWSLS